MVKVWEDQIDKEDPSDEDIAGYMQQEIDELRPRVAELEAEVLLKAEYCRTTSNAHEAACADRDLLNIRVQELEAAAKLALDALQSVWVFCNGLTAEDCPDTVAIPIVDTIEALKTAGIK